MERSYSIIIKPPEEVSENIRKKAYKVSDWTKLNPHISLCTSILSENTDFIDRVGSYLETMDPFEFTLNKVNSINPPRVVFLTSDDQQEIIRLTDLYNETRLSLEGDTRIVNSRDVYTPPSNVRFFPNKITNENS